MITLRRYLILFVCFLTAIFLYHIVSESRWRKGNQYEELYELESTARAVKSYWDEDNNAKNLPTIHQARLKTMEPIRVFNEQITIRLKDILQSPSNIARFDFSKCKMSNCFDFSRCRTNDSLRVHIVPEPSQENNEFNLTGESNIIHKNILKIVRNSKYYEPNPDNACVFILEYDTIDRDPLSQSFRPIMPNLMDAKYQYGMNHLIFNLYSGTWPDYRENDYSGLNIGAAILARASNSITHHRPNYDISIPLFSYLHQATENLNQTQPNLTLDYNKNRTYFLTFKGKRYVIGSGSETRNSLFHLNNQNDVIMLTTCRHGKKWRESKDYRCSEDESIYNQYDFIDLMKESTFCLTPRGRRLGSFRFLEALGYGCIPVILSDGWVWPFGEVIDWSKAAIQFNENLLLQVPDLLRDISQDTIDDMSKNCIELYARYFSTIEKIVLTTLDIIEKRIQNQLKFQE